MSNNKPLVSVILPNYNNGPYLKEAIDSILNQSYSNFEFIIIDDCSTDNSIEIIESYNDQRIIFKVKEENSGIVDSLNIGLDIAKGEYMLRMDGDDISTPDRMEKLVNFMEDNPSIGVGSSAIQNFGMMNDLWEFEVDPQRNKAMLLFGHGIGHASSIFRMKYFKENGIRYRNGYPFVEDYKLFIDLNKVADFSSISEPLYKYRRLEFSSTILNKKSLRKRIKNIYSEEIKKLIIVDPNDFQLDIHFDISYGEFNQPLKVYFNWAKELLGKNNSLKIYPQHELISLFDNKIDRIKFKAIDKSIWNIFSIIYYNKKINLPLIRYTFARIKNMINIFS